MTAPPPPRADRGPDVVLVRYGELSLKGGNRKTFEERLIGNIHAACKHVSKLRVQRQRGRLIVLPERRVSEVAARLQSVLGIVSVSPAWTVEAAESSETAGAPRPAGRSASSAEVAEPNAVRHPTPDAIAAVAERVLADALDALPANRPIPFRVRTTRADKTFPMQSAELDRFVADHVVPPRADRLEVRLRAAELELGIDVRSERTYVFAGRLPGLGGLPTGTMGRALCLLSGGIDSPVAAWMTMRRGCTVDYVTFHSPPFVGESSRRKVVELAQALARYQPLARLHVVPFAAVQTAIRDATANRYRTVLYRRLMQRIASELARASGAGALVTGESLGQVASQTLENLACIEAASSLPVLRPLVGLDKQETIALARKIGTLERSNRAEPDCCTVFMPARPILYGKLAECEANEARIDVASLVHQALAQTESQAIEE